MKISTARRLLALTALIACANWSRIAPAAAQDNYDLSTTEITIFTPDGEEVIGHGRYKFTHVEGFEVVEGENKYLDGEYDREEERLRLSVAGLPPVLVHYEHHYFNPDGSVQYEDSLDARTGAASCRRYDSKVPDIRETTLEVPADTYAGATQLMLVVGRLREGAGAISLHIFNCIPEPRIIPVKGTPITPPVTWPMYPGKLVKLEVEPDLGWLNVVIAPFIPKIYVWFDPADSFNYVGGIFDRYYKGRHVLMVRTHDANPVAQSSTAPPSAH